MSEESSIIHGATITEIPDPIAYAERLSAQAAQAPHKDAVEAVESAWREHVYGTPLVHDTDNANRLQALKADLIRRLTE